MSKRQIAALAAVVLVPLAALVVVLISIGSNDDKGSGTTTEAGTPGSGSSPEGRPSNSSPAVPTQQGGGTGGARRSVPAPNLSARVLDGGSGPIRAKVAPATTNGTLNLGKLEGKPVVITLWSSWCAPCRSSIRVVQAASEQLAKRGVVFLGFAVQDKDADARRFQKMYGITYPTVQDSKGDAAKRLGATGVPETFFISGDRQIVGHVVGAASLAQIELGASAAQKGTPLGTRQGGARLPLR
jgi:cytochrome c biogenesis protein CcmG, thiol:disulfide interchange protein DsbE